MKINHCVRTTRFLLPEGKEAISLNYDIHTLNGPTFMVPELCYATNEFIALAYRNIIIKFLIPLNYFCSLAGRWWQEACYHSLMFS
jgi:hypothetical protein